MNEDFNLKEVKIHRTKEGTIIETAFAIIAVIVWGLIIWMIYRAPDTVPTHFDGSGKPNAYGSPIGVIIPCIILTIAAIACMVVAYFPSHINGISKITNIRQVALTILSTRLAGITLLLLALAVVYTMLGMSSPSPFPILAAVGLLLLNIIVFQILIHKNR